MDAAELSFPLVPRWRPVGSAFGRLRAARRGIGSSVAGTRAYRPGDDPSLIDWKLSARLSSLRGEADFVVREDFADEAPRLVVLADRSPSMALYPDDLPWLSKPRALEAVWRAVATTAVRELGLAGYLDTAAGESWFSPRSAVGFDAVAERQSAAAFDGEPDGLELAFERLAQSRRSLPPGSFVFVCSDFVRPLRPEVWLRALGFRWDLVPVVVQDPVWEQSFPPVGGLVVPFADPARGRVRKVRLSPREAECGAGRTRRASSGCSPTSAVSGSTRFWSGTLPPMRCSHSSRPGLKRGLRTGGGVAVRRVAIGVVVAAVVLAVVLALGWFRGGSGPAPAQPLSATAALATPALSFGDPLAARVEVLADPKQVDVGSLRVRPRSRRGESSPRPGSDTPGLGRCSSTAGRSSACRRRACPGGRLPERRFLPALISYRSPAGRTVRRVVEWPTYRVVTRLTSPDIGDPTQHLSADTSLPPVTYRIAPGTLQALLAALAARSWSQRGCSSGSHCRGGNGREVPSFPRSRERFSSSGEHVERLPGASAPGARPAGA